MSILYNQQWQVSFTGPVMQIADHIRKGAVYVSFFHLPMAVSLAVTFLFR